MEFFLIYFSKEGICLDVLNDKKIQDGVCFHSVIDEKFKFNRISVNFVVKMDEKTASLNALLSFLLRKRCMQYPNMLDLGKKLQELYGASLFNECKKIGDNHLISFGIVSLDDEFSIEGENINQQASRLLASIVFEPLIQNGKFIEEDIEIEKQNLIELVKAQYNDKRTYSFNQAVHTLFDGRGYGCNKYGDVESIKQIENSRVIEEYMKMLRSAEVHIMFTGRRNYSDCFEVFKEKYNSIDRGDIYRSSNQKYIKRGELKSRLEKDQVVQSKLVLCFASSVEYDSKIDNVIWAMTALLGGTPISKLFVNVREKLSLCYYCSAQFDPAKGLIFIESGVEHENIEKAKAAILEQFEDIKNGKFTQDELFKVVLALENVLKAVGDSAGAIESYYLSQLCRGKIETPDKKIENIKKVKKQDIVEVANLFSIVMDYTLTSEG